MSALPCDLDYPISSAGSSSTDRLSVRDANSEAGVWVDILDLATSLAKTKVAPEEPWISYSTAASPHDLSPNDSLAGWHAFLDGISGPHGSVSPSVVACARRSADSLSSLGQPTACQTGEGGVYMCWEKGRHHLEVEVTPSRSIEWLYMDVESGRFDGGETYASLPGGKLLAWSRLFR